MSTPEHIWYFAYGANMSSRVLSRRGLTPMSSLVGRLDGYRLRFSHRGLICLEPAFANIEPDVAGVVHGVAHGLRPDQLARLDRIEGAEYGHVAISVQLVDGRRVDARAYLDPHIARGLLPSRRYLHTCLEGAREFGLPRDYVRALAAQPALHIPVISDIARLLVGTAECLRRAGLRPEHIRMARRARAARAGASHRRWPEDERDL